MLPLRPPPQQLPVQPQGMSGMDQQTSPGTEVKAVEILDAMLKLATLYQAAEADQQDKLTMQRASTLLQQLLAKDESDQQQRQGALARLTGGG